MRVCFGATVLNAVSYDWPLPYPGETALGTNVALYQALKQIISKKLCVESEWLQFIRFADLKLWSQSAIVVSSSSGPHVCWLTVFMLVRHWC